MNLRPRLAPALLSVALAVPLAGTATPAQAASAGTASLTDQVLGLRVSHPAGWRAEPDRLLYDAYSVRLVEPPMDADDPHSGRTAARLAVHYQQPADHLESVVGTLLDSYAGTPVRRWTTRVGPGIAAVAVGPVPGGQVSTNVYFAAHGRVYEIDLYTEELDATGRALLASLRLAPVTRSVASLGLPDARAAVRGTGKFAAPARGGSAAPAGDVSILAAEYQLSDGCWAQPTDFFIQTSHGPTANSSTAYPGWSQMGTPNFWGERTHGNLGLGRCTSTYYTNDYYAIDYYLDWGDPIYSPFKAGYVTYAGWDSGNWYDYGVMVVIQSPNGKYWSLSAHLDSVNVYVGQYVTDATVIGWADSTGYADPYSHLHQVFYRWAQTSYGRPYGGQGLKQTRLTFLGNGGGVYSQFFKYKWVSW